MPHRHAEDLMNYVRGGWHHVYHAVDNMSVTRATTIGGTGSVVSVSSVITTEHVVTGLQVLTISLGAIGGILSVGLLILKFVQQRREMDHWKRSTKHPGDGQW